MHRPAGCRSKSTGYVVVTVDGLQYYAHRVAFAIHTGSHPPEFIDHINRNRADNRWENLRPASHRENSLNADRIDRANGFRWLKRDRIWTAQIKHHNEEIHLGSFQTILDARAAYLRARKELRGH